MSGGTPEFMKRAYAARAASSEIGFRVVPFEPVG